MVAARAYWWNRLPNFGDALAPLILARFANLENIEWNPIETADIASIGSILEHIPFGWSGYIVGSGLLRETSMLKFDPAGTKVLALRGPLTARHIPGNFALGDPGLLVSELIGPNQLKKCDLGIVPHWQDDQLAERFRGLIPEKFSCKVINPSDDPLVVLNEIASCRRVVTSSLHGMIVADSLGIPRRVEACEKMNADGADFKFRDYSAAIHSSFEFGKMMEPERNRVDDSRFAVYDAFRELSRAYGKS